MAIHYNKEEDTYYFNCPHCNLICQVPTKEIRCTIFRHAVYKHNMTFVDPHASKRQCDKWVVNGEVYGCGKPFKFDGKNIQICDYI